MSLWTHSTNLMNDLFVFFLVFFFSSRRRHTRFDCDWSSDVCSSDLARVDALEGLAAPVDDHPPAWPVRGRVTARRKRGVAVAAFRPGPVVEAADVGRSEERRVGKECRSRRGA